MIIDPIFIPHAAPSEPEQGPPTAEHTNLPADASVWDAVRRCYVEKETSSKLLAEQFGLKERTVRDHAQRGGWRDQRAQHRAAAAPSLAVDDAVALALAEHRKARQLELLVDPTVAGSMIFVAGLIQESLVRAAPHETRLWQKTFADLKRQAPDLERAFNGGLDPADILRRTHVGELLAAEMAARADRPADDDDTD